ncbi:hypothetical protein P7K49_000160 [Saguinus oedipus]|uniref:Uncharacterized protein n=1 Tax=Saguinus oedipus TaxID=9490 RepID=A0ABQ9WAW1_SAGOE|nr:hypothetical protein P7K49_000160 [Saguinus oedipus]
MSWETQKKCEAQPLSPAESDLDGISLSDALLEERLLSLHTQDRTIVHSAHICLILGFVTLLTSQTLGILAEWACALTEYDLRIVSAPVGHMEPPWTSSGYLRAWGGGTKDCTFLYGAERGELLSSDGPHQAEPSLLMMHCVCLARVTWQGIHVLSGAAACVVDMCGPFLGVLSCPLGMKKAVRQTQSLQL